MKKTGKKTFTAILCALIAASALTACAKDDTGVRPYDGTSVNDQAHDSEKEDGKGEAGSESTKTPDADTADGDAENDIKTDTYKTQISYYMELTESLQAELVKVKENNYIEACEYELKIGSLEETVKELNQTIELLKKIDKLPPSSSTQAPSNESLSSKPEFKYTLTDGQIIINEYVGNAVDVNVPSSIGEYKVVKIGEGAFKGKLIRSVTLPSGIYEIDWFAFSGCTTLESVTVPSSVMSVGYGAFDHCPQGMVINCSKGSYIEAYAKSWGIKTYTE